ncbi:carbon-nitrogen hydrolase family protein [Granulicoccus sp. GXG6511]|uniref:carbon-nitrogen hydrolase family protein n=1 Tax=Granulicoccus sp. GXG6511 TaxID=3381351 RepID=UPI003D7D5CED
MRVALAQICSGPEVEDNLAQVREQVAKAAALGARLVVFPEATMRAFGHNLASVAEPLDGPFATAIGDLATEFGLTVAAGMFTPARSSQDGSRVRNTLVVAVPTGPAGGGRPARVQGYDKIHLFDAFGFSESDTVEAGDDELRVEVDGTTVGVAICYDIRFPQLFINHARAGAKVILVPASWGSGPGKLDQWQVLARARALDSTSWILACGQADPKASGVEAKPDAPTGIGHSMVVSPTGAVVAAAGSGPELVIADLVPGSSDRARRDIPVLTNARLS